jgi:hypothetical protein
MICAIRRSAARDGRDVASTGGDRGPAHYSLATFAARVNDRDMLANGLFALLSDAPPVNELAVALSPAVGWLLLACAVVVALLGVAQSDRWRRLWLRTEDPRALGLFRILFALFVILNVGGLYEHFTFLFTDEGIFAGDTARELLAREQFVGFGDGVSEPAGFFDWRGALEFVKGPKYSLLFFWDSPAAFYGHLAAFLAVMLAFMLGWKTRLMGVLGWIGMHSITLRNPLYMEGTDLVYSCFFFYLILSRCGHAYSLDNWLRCRRLARRGELSLPGGPGDGAGAAPSPAHPAGLQAIYRRIPAWPRLLMILQLATIYVYTGCAKTGGIWSRGDSLYYALNMDHFYRVPPQYLSAIFGTNVFRLMTWTVHVWQIAFPLVVVGLVTRWAIRERLPRYTGARLWLVRGLWTSLGLLALAVAEVAWPVHYDPANAPLSLPATMWLFGVCWLAGMALIAWLWHRLRDRPFEVRLRGRTHRLDLEWFCGWFLGRRIFLTIGILFHGHLLVLMNIGMFAPIMLLTYMVCLSGPELASILRGLGRALAHLGVPGIPADVRAGRTPIPTEDPTLPHLRRDAARLPEWALLTSLAFTTCSVVLAARGLPGVKYCVAAGLLTLVVAAVRAARRDHGRVDPAACPPDRPWAYGPLGRLLVSGLVVYHIAAVATWCLPDKQCLSSFRTRAHKPFVWWLTRTHTAQGWNMFAPNPPRHNVFLKVVVTDADGVAHDMRTDMYAPERKPIPWILNDRIFKMNRRMSGGESGNGDWYQKWYGRYFCRDWELRNGGRAPEKVELYKISYRIPGPDEVAAAGYYLPEVQLAKFGKESHLHTTRCATDPEAQLSDEIRARHGLPPAPEGTYKPWLKHRKKKWDERLKKEGKR